MSGGRWRRSARRVVAACGVATGVALLPALAPAASLDRSPAPTIAPRQGAVPRGGPPAARADSTPGSELDVYVMTMGQGDLVWERFGHNALGIRDRRTGTDVVYNWGTFSFEQADFLPRFLRGQMLYWLAPNDAVQTLMIYQQLNRSVTVQWLALSAAQKDSIRRFVEWNARDENRFYRYDYYRDNCSTRVRDVVDGILGGAIRRATDTAMTPMTYRDHSLRLMDGMFWTRSGIDLGLGHPTDRPISRWEAMFIPMEVQRALRDVRVADATGALVPLVEREEVLFEARRPAERRDVPTLVWGALAIGLGLAGIFFLLGYRTPGRVGALVLSTTWALLAGLVGLLLALLWLATDHVAAHANQNLFFAQPLWLGVAVLVPLVRWGRRTRSTLLFLLRVSVVLTVIGALVAITPWGQPSGAIAAVAAPVNLAVYLLVLRLVHLAQIEANRDRELNARRGALSRKP